LYRIYSAFQIAVEARSARAFRRHASGRQMPNYSIRGRENNSQNCRLTHGLLPLSVAGNS
jgi:hypothetical protein